MRFNKRKIDFFFYFTFVRKMVWFFITTHFSLSPSLRLKSSVTSEGTVMRLRDPRMVIAVSRMHLTFSNSTFMIPHFF